MQYFQKNRNDTCLYWCCDGMREQMSKYRPPARALLPGCFGWVDSPQRSNHSVALIRSVFTIVCSRGNIPRITCAVTTIKLFFRFLILNAFHLSEHLLPQHLGLLTRQDHWIEYVLGVKDPYWLEISRLITTPYPRSCNNMYTNSFDIMYN